MILHNPHPALSHRERVNPEMPSLKTDADAEKFVETSNLAEYDLSGFKPMRFEFEPKVAALSVRLPQNLLDALKLKAKNQGISYTQYVRLLLERDIQGLSA
jgi:predicted DNA binding CopG/RHH family protein